MQFASADANTIRGSYNVDVTTPASRAGTATLFDGGAGASTRVGVRVGAVTVTHDVSVGQSPTQIADGLNAEFGRAGLSVVAELSGSGLVVRSTQWGSARQFRVQR